MIDIQAELEIMRQLIATSLQQMKKQCDRDLNSLRNEYQRKFEEQGAKMEQLLKNNNILHKDLAEMNQKSDNIMEQMVEKCGRHERSIPVPVIMEKSAVWKARRSLVFGIQDSSIKT